MKIVINTRFGGFGISKQCAERMAELGCERAKAELAESESRFFGYGYVEGMDGGYDRTDKYLIQAVEELGKLADGDLAELKIVEIPDGIKYYIDEYDGVESIHEEHNQWD